MFFEKSNIAPRILVIRPGALGDTILALPALQALAASRERSIFELVGYPSVLRLVEQGVPSVPVGKIHSIDRGLFASLFSGAMSDELGAFLDSYDLVIAWIQDRSGSLRDKLARLSTAWLQADPYPSEGSGIHVSEHLLDSLSPLVARLPVTAPQLQPPAEALRECREILRRVSPGEGGFLAIHPGSGSPRKNWPPEKFAELSRMARHAGRRVLVLEGDSDAHAVRALRGLAGEPLPRVHQPSLLTLAAIVSRASAFLGNDSGVSHLAAATGTPTLTIFGPTDPAVWAPKGPYTRIVGCETHVETVWAELVQLERAKISVRGNA